MDVSPKRIYMSFTLESEGVPFDTQYATAQRSDSPWGPFFGIKGTVYETPDAPFTRRVSIFVPYDIKDGTYPLVNEGIKPGGSYIYRKPDGSTAGWSARSGELVIRRLNDIFSGEFHFGTLDPSITIIGGAFNVRIEKGTP